MSAHLRGMSDHLTAGHEVMGEPVDQTHPVNGSRYRVQYCECGAEFIEPLLSVVPAPGAPTPAEPRPVSARLGAEVVASAGAASPSVEDWVRATAKSFGLSPDGVVAELDQTLARNREARACPTCTYPSRETVNMVCQTCGWDYSKG